MKALINKKCSFIVCLFTFKKIRTNSVGITITAFSCTSRKLISLALKFRLTGLYLYFFLRMLFTPKNRKNACSPCDCQLDDVDSQYGRCNR